MNTRFIDGVEYMVPAMHTHDCRTPREQAVDGVRAAEAALQLARWRLRAVVKGEIAAMDPLPPVTGLDAIVAVVSPLLGMCRAAPSGSAWDSAVTWDYEGVAFSVCKSGSCTEFVAEHDHQTQAWTLRSIDAEAAVVTLDEAVKGALVWLAERDVFVSTVTT